MAGEEGGLALGPEASLKPRGVEFILRVMEAIARGGPRPVLFQGDHSVGGASCRGLTGEGVVLLLEESQPSRILAQP